MLIPATFFWLGPASVIVPLVFGIMVCVAIMWFPIVSVGFTYVYVRFATWIASIFQLTATPFVIFLGFFNTGGIAATNAMSRWFPRLRGGWFGPSLVNLMRNVLFAIIGWIWAFISAFLHFWTLLYATLILFLFVGILMYPFLLVERNPETGIEIMDLLFEITRSFYNFAASVFNVVFAILKPFLPIFNLEIRFVVNVLRVVLDVVMHITGAVFAGFTDGWGEAEARDADRFFDTAASKQPGVGTNFDEYTKSCISIVLTMCRILAIVGDFAVDFFELFAIVVAHVLEAFFAGIVWIVAASTCCASSPGCCMSEIGVRLKLDKIDFPDPIGDFGIFSACSDPGTDCRCSALESAGVGNVQIPLIYSKQPSCAERTWTCVDEETVDGTLIGKLSSTSCNQPLKDDVTFKEGENCETWTENRKEEKCSSRRLRERSTAEHQNALLNSTSCYSECEDGIQYDVCLTGEEDFDMRERGQCLNARRLNPLNDHFSEDWEVYYEDLVKSANADKDPHLNCHLLLNDVRGQVWTEWSLPTMMHYTMCLVKQSTSSTVFEPLNKGVKAIHSLVEETHLAVPGHTKRKMATVSIFVQSVSDHIGDAIQKHTKTYVPRSDDWVFHKDRVAHFTRSVNTHGVRRAWYHMLSTLDTIYDDQPGPRRRKPKRRTTVASSNNIFRPGDWNADDSTNFAGGMIRKQRNYTFFDSDKVCPFGFPHRCPDGRTCVASRDVASEECPIAVSTDGWYEWFYSTMYWIRYMFEEDDFNVIVHLLFECWDDLENNPELDPFSRDNMWRLSNYFETTKDFFAEATSSLVNLENEFGSIPNKDQRREPYNFRWCFPMIPPSVTQWYLPKMVWDLSDYVEKECDSESKVCFCSNYASPSETFEADAYWFWFIPIYVYARVKNTLVSAQFILTYYLTAGSILDEFWTWFWLGLWPTGPRWLIELWGDQGQDSATHGFLCIFLHFGSALYVLFWSYIGLLCYRCFFPFGVLVVSDLCDIFLWGWDRTILWAESPFLGRFAQNPAYDDTTIPRPNESVGAARLRRHPKLYNRISPV